MLAGTQYGRGLHRSVSPNGRETVTILTANSNPIATVTSHTRLFTIRIACSCGWHTNVSRFRPDRHEAARMAVRDHLWGSAHK